MKEDIFQTSKRGKNSTAITLTVDCQEGFMMQKQQEVALIVAKEEDYPLFKEELKAAFIQGFVQYFGEDKEPFIPEDDDVEESLNSPNADPYLIVWQGQKIGGIIVKSNKETQRNSVDLFYMNNSVQGKGIGLAAWQAVEEQYPETKVWELYTPYYEKRNLHFYINKCGFQIVEFYHKGNPMTKLGEGEESQLEEEYEFFRFEKVMKR